MSKKAFTLIELMGVITILAIVVLVAVPAITGTLRRNTDKNYENFLETISMACETYVEININKEEFQALKEIGGRVSIPLSDLQISGYIKSNIVNPNTEEDYEELKNKKIEVLKNIDGVIECTYTDEIYKEEGA